MRVANAGESGGSNDGEFRHKIGFGDLQIFLGILQLQLRDFQRFPFDKCGLDKLGLVKIDVRDLRLFKRNQMILVRTQRFRTIEVVHLEVDDVAEIVLAVPNRVAGGQKLLFLAGDPGFRLDHFVAGHKTHRSFVGGDIKEILGQVERVFLSAGLFAPIVERPVIGHDLRDETLHIIVQGFLGDPPVVPGDSDGRHVDVHAETPEQGYFKRNCRSGAVEGVAPHIVLLVGPASRETAAQLVLDTGRKLALDAQLVGLAFRFSIPDVELGVVGNVENLVDRLTGLGVNANRYFLLGGLDFDVRSRRFGAFPANAGGEIRVESALGYTDAFSGVFGIVALDGEPQVLLQTHGDAVPQSQINVGVDKAVVHFAGQKIFVNVFAKRFDGRSRGFPEARPRRKLGLQIFLEGVLKNNVHPFRILGAGMVLIYCLDGIAFYLLDFVLDEFDVLFRHHLHFAFLDSRLFGSGGGRHFRSGRGRSANVLELDVFDFRISGLRILFSGFYVRENLFRQLVKFAEHRGFGLLQIGRGHSLVFFRYETKGNSQQEKPHQHQIRSFMHKLAPKGYFALRRSEHTFSHKLLE